MHWLKQKLQQIKAAGLERKLKLVSGRNAVATVIDGKECINFSGNDYLGLADDPEIAVALIAAVKKYGVGSGASHLVTGHNCEHQLLEEELAEFLGRDRVLLFSSGYMANNGIIPALVSAKGAVFQDRLNHASLIDGAKLSGAKMVRYAHGDVDHLQKRYHSLKEGIVQESMVVTDGVFSMDGDIAPLPQLAQFARDKNLPLMVDDAHGMGVIGRSGRGSVDSFDLNQADVPVLMGTLGKAFGVYGAFVAGEHDLIEYLLQTARTYMFTTALPPSVAAATRAALKKVIADEWRRQQLTDLIAYLKESAAEENIELLASSTPIQPLLIGDSSRAVAISQALADQGVIVSAIRPPTVPEGTARLRITISATHTREHIDRLISAIKTVYKADQNG